ncbi:MAG: hypothetical protein N3A54_00145 [Patescibacteria group bacterium]|nr:hypothetical protein [Patescibacteria group bacterium]
MNFKSFLDFLSERIIKRNGKYYLYSKDGSRKLGGPYRSRKQALKRERQVQYFKHLHEDTLEEARDVGGFYLYFGWFTPTGDVLLPSEDEQTHADMIDDKFDSLSAALKNGYIRFFVETFNITHVIIETSIQYISSVGVPNFVNTITTAMRKLEEMIMSGKIADHFDIDRVPLPEKVLFTFYDDYSYTFSVKTDSLRNALKGRLEAILSESHHAELYIYYGWFTPEGKIIFPDKNSVGVEHFSLLPSNVSGMKQAIREGYVRFISETYIHNKELFMDTSWDYVKNIGIPEFVKKLKRNVEKLENMIVNGEVKDIFGTDPPLPERYQLFVYGLETNPYIIGNRNNFFALVKSRLEEELMAESNG